MQAVSTRCPASALAHLSLILLDSPGSQSTTYPAVDAAEKLLPDFA